MWDLREPWRPLLRGALVGLAMAAALLGGALEGLDRWGLDLGFRLRGPIPPKTPIVIVSIDEDSFDELNLPWPWPRRLFAQFVDRVSRGNPAAIGFDLVFSEPSPEGPEDDQALAMAIRRSGKVVLAAALTEAKTKFYERERLTPPLNLLRRDAAGYGFVNVPQDADAFIRTASLRRPYQDALLSSFDLHLYTLCVRSGIPAPPPPPTFHINFRGGPRTFPTVPFYQVVRGEEAPAAFAGKIVLVGALAPLLHDLHPTPFARHGEMPGVEIHANILETIFQGIPIRRAPRAIAVALVVIAAIVAAATANVLRPLRGLAALTGAAAAYALAALMAFVWQRLWVDLAAVPLTLLLGYGATVVENFIREQREKRRLARYFSPAVVEEVLRQPDDAKLASARRQVTVLFADIRGFTSISERIPAADVVAFLREYLTVATAAVFVHGGTVDKYIGDAIMALYNVPLDQPDHAAQAVRTALAFQEGLRPLGERFRARYGTDLRCGVGVHTGEAVVGTIGSEQRLEYTAIGDTINLGSRLEGLTKEFSVPIIISESTYRELRGRFFTRHIGDVRVKGKEFPVKIYAVAEANSRREARIPVDAALTVVIRTESEVRIPAPVQDLSGSGLLASGLPVEFPKGEAVELQFVLPGTPRRMDGGPQEAGAGQDGAGHSAPQVARTITTHAQVMWTAGTKAGFQFLDVTSEDRRAIQEFLLREGPSREAGPAPAALPTAPSG